jgi:quinoprotein glucose dehydrogenase
MIPVNRLMRALLLGFAVHAMVVSAQVHEAWTFHTGATAPNARASRLAAFEDTPVLADDRLFVITPYNQVIALDPGSGEPLWTYDPKIKDKDDYSEMTARGVVVSKGVVFFGTLDARLIAIRASDGSLLWQTYIHPEPNNGGYQITSPPVVTHGLVIIGSAIADGRRASPGRGIVNAFDAKTGKKLWSWDPTPKGVTGAANVWAPMSLDEERNMILLATSSPSPDFYGGMRLGDDKNANSVVALRASTGKFLWAFQAVHHDLWDYDVPSRPELVEVKGKPAVAVLTKMGHYFLLDRITGKPLLGVDERSFPQSDVPGEHTSATQPVPRSGIFTEQKFTPRSGWCSDQFHKLRYDGIFTPPSLQGSLQFPGNFGGSNWGSGSYDRDTELIVVAANRLATAVRLIPRATFNQAGHGDTGERWGQEYGPQLGSPYAMSRRTFVDLDGKPCNVEPWGTVTAIEVATGKVRWEIPASVSLGGPLVVDGLVFFAANVFEHTLHAYSLMDGHEIWHTELPFSAQSVPGTYMWQGKRYIVIAAGGHGKIDGSKLGDAVIAFQVD